MLINKELLKKFGIFPANYDLTEVMNYVDIAEKIWITKTIGYAQYDELQEQVKNNNLTPENSTLLVEAIYPYLAFAVAYECSPMIWAHVSEAGITKGQSDNSISLDLKEMTLVQSHLRRQVEARKDFAIDWIADHIEYYPLIAECTCECSTCCCERAKLNQPNPYQQLYKPRRRNTDLR